MYTLPEDYINTATDCADIAEQLAQQWFRNLSTIEQKADQSPVTIADKTIEQALRQIITQRYPDHGFYGEETGLSTGDSSWQWVIDPIDGTKSFATGNPIFGTLIGLLENNIPRLGLIAMPILQERWLGIDDKPTTLNGQRCRPSNIQNLNQAKLQTTTPDMFDSSQTRQYQRLVDHCQFRVFGGDCYSYGLLCSGHVDIVCEADMKPHDFMALVPVVTGAGGIITDWHGKPLSMASDGTVLASANATLHAQALRTLAIIEPIQ